MSFKTNQILKPESKLITIGFLTCSPFEDRPSEWRVDKIPPEDLFLERAFYKNISNLQWRNFRTSTERENEFRELGFSEVVFHYDTLRIFPVIIAKR